MVLGLVKPDVSGSKSYFYSEDYRNAVTLTSQIGITGWTLETAGLIRGTHPFGQSAGCKRNRRHSY